MSTQPTAWVKLEPLSENNDRFIVSPLDRGMGTTLGNSMRRVLLSSLGGHAITRIKIDGVKHEFSPVPGVVEDVLDIILNLKGVVFKSETEDAYTLSIDAKKKGTVTAADISLPAGITIVNTDLHIAEVADGGHLKMVIEVEYGNGYRTAEEQAGADEVDVIRIDSSFSPVVRVNHRVENTRVGKKLGYDSLTLDVWTDGSIEPESVVRKSAAILEEKFTLFARINEEPEVEVKAAAPTADAKLQESVLALTIDELELSARSSNCLKRAGIETVSELVNMDLSELIKIKNFGKKSADEINSKLEQYSLALKGSLEE